ncbi:Zn-ribbon domain-containing OB-fold protein [Acidiferrimicrobium sp. IK]|uniref:Zn-ribbon domain-containing OB-fold protein n=1 Tax=Acidiferrimicrobium sp. IK TaxID=2871700 RepID=UPI0021CB12F9|nr:Zn-ribbon domain-containing OB-fold protein [Acidiferrimicrobium sp. IK]MCU4183444.1 Zn-ribbon domain-containing OB-fold protein [Acidiferrimicrobium sp. IK]
MPDAARRDLPTIDDDTRPFWDAVRGGRFLIVRCRSCGAAHHYPRPFCPSCWSEEVEWEQASGRATLYTWSTVFVNDAPPFSSRLPYVAAVVDLEEGPRVMTNVVGCPPEELRVGMALTVAYEEATPEITIPVFTPAA